MAAPTALHAPLPLFAIPVGICSGGGKLPFVLPRMIGRGVPIVDFSLDLPGRLSFQGISAFSQADGRQRAKGGPSNLPTPTRNSGLGDVTVDQSGAVWFLELRANKIGRLAEGRFTEFGLPTPSAGLTALAAAPDGTIWFTELSAGKLGRLREGEVAEFRLPRTERRPFGVAVDAANNIWYTDLSGWLGMLPASGAKAP